MTRRVAVYGKDTPEKTGLIDRLKTSSTQLEFLSSTPPNRFRLVADGRNPPFNLASLQILFLNLENETVESIANIKRDYRLCDFTRPLMFLLKGEATQEITMKLNSCLSDNYIVFKTIGNIDKLQVDDIVNELECLGNDFYDKQPANNQFR